MGRFGGLGSRSTDIRFFSDFQGGVQVGSQILLYFTVLKIWNTGVQELFTEFEKLVVLKFGDVANSAPFAKCREMYRISHI